MSRVDKTATAALDVEDPSTVALSSVGRDIISHDSNNIRCNCQHLPMLKYVVVNYRVTMSTGKLGRRKQCIVK